MAASLYLPLGIDPPAARALGVEPGALGDGPALCTPRPRDDQPVEGVTLHDLELRAAEPAPDEGGPVVLGAAGPRPLPLEPSRPAVMGILNVTPDSFHDGDPVGRVGDHVARALELLRQGAAVLDVGGESTRPGADAVPAEAEVDRVVPVIRALRERGVEAPISIDTSKAAVAAAALEAGADWINDVTGLAGDPAMAKVAAEAACPVVLMHMRGTPRSMRGLTEYGPWCPPQVAWELLTRVEAALAAGVRREDLVLDPGIGFAKSWRQNLELIRRLDVLTALGLPVLVGASRKSLLAHAAGTGPDTAQRLPGSLALAIEAARRGAALVRVHDVGETVQALATWQAVEAGHEAQDLGPG